MGGKVTKQTASGTYVVAESMAVNQPRKTIAIFHEIVSRSSQNQCDNDDKTVISGVGTSAGVTIFVGEIVRFSLNS